MTKIPEDHWIRTRPILHKGHFPEFPPNTIESCILAMEKSYPIEIDVRITKQGVVIMIHDMTLLKTAHKFKTFRSITESDLESIRSYNSDCKIGTLKKLLNVINGRVPILIDIKFSGDVWTMKPLCSSICDLLSNYSGEYAIQSFNASIPDIYKQYNPKAIVGMLSPTLPIKGNLAETFSNMKLQRKTNYDFVSYYLDFLPNEILKKILEERELPLICYTVTNKDQEGIAIANNANFIWSAINNNGYEAPKILKR